MSKLRLLHEVVLENDNGVKINAKFLGHYSTTNAKCTESCGCFLMVAPPVFTPEHEEGDPVMVCEDHGAHAYRFKDLVIGNQPEQGGEL